MAVCRNMNGFVSTRTGRQERVDRCTSDWIDKEGFYLTFINRISRLQAQLQAQSIDLMIICDRENLIYYTGLTEIECLGLMVPACGDPQIAAMTVDLPLLRTIPGICPLHGYMYGMGSLGATLADLVKALGIEKPRIAFTKYFVEVAVFEALWKAIPDLQLVNGAQIAYQVRSHKTSEELDLIRQASGMVLAGMEAAVAAIEPGMTETEVLGHAELAMRKAGSEGSSFRMQVLSSDRQMLTHPHARHVPLKNNQPVVIHIGATTGGYGAKMCRTVMLGDVAQPVVDTYRLTVRAQQAAIARCTPGTPVREVWQAAYAVYESEGLGKYLIPDIGYGIGIRQSEFYPIIGKNRDYILEEGMAVDLMFPTIYHPTLGGPRVTDTLFVTDPPEILTKYPTEIIRK